MATRIGVDIGGTFTDLVYHDEETGETVEGKVLTVPHAPEEGVVEAVRKHVPKTVIESADFFLHGTTVGLNALLERRGAKVGLITTDGFRDILEIRRGDRDEMYNLFWRQPEPLVPRHRRLGVAERMNADGEVVRELDEDSVRAAVRQLMGDGVDTIAVCFLHAYANPAHEQKAAEIIATCGFDGGISLSHRISGEYREYERTCTTVIDAFVRARMSHYLQRLDGRLRELGFNGTSLITRSGSGSMTFSEAEDRPFETIMSGPVAGAEGAGELARAIGLSGLITADAGGTSFDTAVIIDGRPQVLYQGMVDGMPVQTSWVDVRSIGAGGGSIAYVDAGGLMRVGPRSAGADPGPAAYGRGGTEPTLTDAASVLGMLGRGELKSGITLDVARAEAAVGAVGSAIGKDTEATAIGILRIAAASMANAMREVTVEQGLDPRDMALVPFGGAGPLMATLLADELQMRRMIVPPLAGNFSAWGLLGADMVQSSARTRIMDLTDDNLAAAGDILGELFAEIGQRAKHLRQSVVHSAKLDLRYKGQDHWLSIDVPLKGDRFANGAAEVGRSFVADYLRTFGGDLNEVIEIVSVRAVARVHLPRRKQISSGPTAPDRATSDTFETWSFHRGARLPFALVKRGAIDGSVEGPAIITESTATFYLDDGWTARRGEHGELVVDRKEH